MTTTHAYRDRPDPIVNEAIYAQHYAQYLRGARYHPAIAAVMAYEDATQTISPTPNPNRGEPHDHTPTRSGLHH